LLKPGTTRPGFFFVHKRPLAMIIVERDPIFGACLGNEAPDRAIRILSRYYRSHLI